MSANKFKPYFEHLKDTFSLIENSVNDVTTAFSNDPSEIDCSEACENLDEKFNAIKQLKNEALTMKKELESRREYNVNYFYDFQDLVFELEEKVDAHEKYLQKYGFELLKVEPIAEKKVLPSSLPEKDIKKKDKTPTIYDFIDVNHIDSIKRSMNSSGEKGNCSKDNDETPKLIFAPVVKASSHSSELLPSPTQSESIHLKAKKRNTEEIEKEFVDRQNIARKLDFEE